MKKFNLKTILQMVVILSVMTSLLLCLNGCKKKPSADGTGPAADASSEATGAPHNTQPAQTTQPTQATQPTLATTPVDATTPEGETIPSDCVHVLGDWEVDKPSTCTTEGSRYKKCTVCKYTIETEPIPTVPHSAGNWIVDKKATCTEEGSMHQECSQCKKLLFRIVVAKADHNTRAIPGYEPTATTQGLTQGYYCRTCGNDVQEQFKIPALNDPGVTYTVNSDGRTCTVTGLVNKSSNALILPDTIDGYKITAIADGAFTGNTALKTVYLPDTVTSIGARAFSGCVLLNNITYEGKTTQWISIAKGSDCIPNNGSLKIYCSNNYLIK